MKFMLDVRMCDDTLCSFIVELQQYCLLLLSFFCFQFFKLCLRGVDLTV